MQLFVANVEKISLKIKNSILHGHGEKGQRPSYANKSGEEEHKGQLWGEGYDHGCNDAQKKLFLNFIL